MKQFVMICVLVATSSSLLSQVWQSVQPGNWSSASTWTGFGTTGDYPGQNGNTGFVIIQHAVNWDISNGYPNYGSTSTTVNEQILDGGGSLTINANTQMLITNGYNTDVSSSGGYLIIDCDVTADFQGELDINNDGRVVVYNSTGTLEFSGSGDFASGTRFEVNGISGADITFTSSSAYVFHNGAQAFGDGTNSGATMTINGKWRFEHGASFFAQSNGASVSFGSSPIFEFDISSGAGWRNLSSPVSTTLASFSTQQALNLYDVNYGNATNVYRWRANNAGSNTAHGWTAANNLNQGIGGSNNPWMIYIGSAGDANFGPNQNPAEITGTPYNGEPSFTLHRTHDPNGDFSNTDRGWNMLPNPYPTILDLEAVSNELNLTYKAVHIWDATGGQYDVFLNGATQISHSNGLTNGTTATQYIRPFQPFWVKLESAEGSTESVQITLDMRSSGTTSTNYLKTDQNSNQLNFRLAVSDSTDLGDIALVYFDSSAVDTLNYGLDAYKRFSMSYGYPSLYFTTMDRGDTAPVAIKALPFDSVIVHPVMFSSPLEQTYSITGLGEGIFDSTFAVSLVDRMTNDTVIIPDTGYAFDYLITDSLHRFDLLFQMKEVPIDTTQTDTTINDSSNVGLPDKDVQNRLIEFAAFSSQGVSYSLSNQITNATIELISVDGRILWVNSKKVDSERNAIQNETISNSSILILRVVNNQTHQSETRKLVKFH